MVVMFVFAFGNKLDLFQATCSIVVYLMICLWLDRTNAKLIN